MEIHELNRIFDQLAPTPEQEQAILDRLLQTERKGKPMKRLKKLTVIGIAAALMIVTCAAAVVTGLDQRLLDYFGAGTEQAELLSSGVVEVNESHTYDNGWTVNYGQLLADRWSVAIMVEVTAPEDFTFVEGGSKFFTVSCDHLDASGEPVRGDWSAGMTWIEDDDPADNHVTMLWEFSKSSVEEEANEPYTGGYARFILRRMEQQDGTKLVTFEEWPCTVKLPDTDSGIFYDLGQPITIEGMRLELSTLYVSPISFRFTLRGAEDDLFSNISLISDRINFPFDNAGFEVVPNTFLNTDIVLNLEDGTKILADFGGDLKARMRTEDRPSEALCTYHMSQSPDPAQVVSVTMFGQTYELR